MKQGSEAFQQNPNYEKYKAYKALGGTVSQEGFQNILNHVESERNTPPHFMRSERANDMAEAAGITLSPETVTIYGLLHDESGANDQSDQKLLAEALRISGDTHPLSTFIEKYPHIFN